MNRNTTLISLAVALGGISMKSEAAQIIQQENWGPLSPAFDSVPVGPPNPLTFNQFDPTLGTLQGITIFTFVEFDQGNASVDAEGTLPSDITVEFGVDVAYTSSDVSLLDLALQPIGASVTAFNSETFVNVGANDGDDVLTFQDDGGNDNRTMAITMVTDSETASVNPLAYAGYTGTGTFDINFAGSSLFNISSTGSTSGSFGPGIAQGHVIVTYDYLPAVPEPSTPLAILAGSLIFGLRRRGPKASR